MVRQVGMEHQENLGYKGLIMHQGVWPTFLGKGEPLKSFEQGKGTVRSIFEKDH